MRRENLGSFNTHSRDAGIQAKVVNRVTLDHSTLALRQFKKANLGLARGRGGTGRGAQAPARM